MVGHRTVNAAVAGSSPAIRAISLFLRLNVHVFASRLAVIVTPLMCEAVAKPGVSIAVCGWCCNTNPGCWGFATSSRVYLVSKSCSCVSFRSFIKH